MGGQETERTRCTTRPAAWLRVLAAAALFFALAPAARAQEDTGQLFEGVNGEKYNIKQSIELGGRIDSISGNGEIYNTFVNLHSGFRLLGFTTEMRSLDNKGDLFDRLYINSYGYGGDPNDVTRVRISKNKWYNFDVLLRRDENYWDYSLQANPLNPTTAFANGPAGFAGTCTSCVLGFSPHEMDTRRYLSDYSLLLLPQSKVRFRLGYSRNINEGPSFTTIHQGTEQLLFQDMKDTVNTYRLGVDYRVAPRTSISYDEIWNDFKGDTGAEDQLQKTNYMPVGGLPQNLFLLSNGAPVDLGVSFNSAASQPCGATFNAGPAPPAGTVNPTCSAYLNYLTHSRVRTSTPTEQISLQSSYWKQVDISARFNYTAGNAEEFNYLENVLGRESRTNLFNGQTNGNVNGQRVAATGDFGVTWHITDAWSLLDSFHYSNFHNPLEFSFSDCSFFTANLTPAAGQLVQFVPTGLNIVAPTQFVPSGLTTALPVNCIGPPGTTQVTPPAPPPGPAAPVHSSSSYPDLELSINGGFQKMEDDMNLAEVDYQLSSKLGVRAGFRYRHRDIDYSSFVDNMEFFFPGGPGGTVANFFNAARGDCAATGGVLPAGCTPVSTNGALEFVTPVVAMVTPGPVMINEYSGLFGIWAKPIPNWRISFDTELMSADNTFTRISPRQWQEYRIRSTYKPASWVNLSGSVRIWEGRDNVTQVNSLQHDRSYGFSALFTPNDKWAIDFTYDYNDVFSSILVCYPTSPSPPGIQKCPTVIGAPAQTSVYTNKSNYGGFDLMWKPLPRLTTHLGGNFTGTSGSASLLMLNPNAEPASLDSKWFSPTGGLDYEFSKRWTGRAYWNYYGYHEDNFNTFQDLFAPRNFHTNSVTLSARYAF